MDCISTRLPYRQTNYFTKIILDYLDHAENLKQFYLHPSSLQGIQKAIANRKNFPTNRKILAEALKKQYAGTVTHNAVHKNTEALLSENTFTITTAHQPNIFTGPLYFIYKILHAVKLAEHCKASLPGYNFVPVYYMGSEDADLDELGHIYLGGQKIEWKTKQTGPVGKMKVDKEFIKLISQIEGQLIVLPHGNEIFSLIKDCYAEGIMIQNATFKLVNALFGEYGLIVLIPDSASLKKQVAGIFEDDLLNERPSVIVEQTAGKLQAAGYKLQANPREINLFYLEDGTRERIVRKNSEYRIQNTELKFTQTELLKELNDHPERFSPNVILRGIYQETILPNIVYIGGGGEIAYWLQLKDLFEHYKVPYPVLVLRNSFLIVEKKWLEKISRLGFTIEDFFLPEHELLKRLVARETKNEIRLNGNFTEAEQLYESLKKQAVAVDTSLARHVDALKTQSISRLQELEKKMLRAEKRKFTDQQRQIHTIKEKLFPKNGLQERIENFMYHYAKWGKDFIQQAYQHSLSLEQEFVIMSES
jgi:bacillithiol biosynthesis cysteine-adding enzyme BshC